MKPYGSTACACHRTKILEAYVGSGWVDGLLPSSCTQDGHQRASRCDRRRPGGGVEFPAGGDPVGELNCPIFAARTLSDQADALFMESIKSFRRLGPDETTDARPLRIAVAVAAPGDTIGTMAARMVVPNRPVEHFMLLNGLSAGDALTAGEHYKIVTE